MMPNLPHYTVADYIADRLKELGVGHIFDVPGDFVTNFMNVVVQRHPGLKLVTTPNELIAGYAADGYARLRGIGAVAVTYGVGAFSLINAVAGSWVERNPVIVLNGAPSQSDRTIENQRGVLVHHSTGDFASNQDAYRNVTLIAISISDADEAPAMIDQALTLALQYKRPVYIEVWNDRWQAACKKPAQPLQILLPKSDPVALQAAADAIVARINSAKAPLLWAGIELQRYGIQPSFEQLLSQTDLYYVTTLLAKSVISETSPRFLGVYTAAADTAVNDIVKSRDLIVGLGTLVTDDYTDIVNDSYEQMIVSYDGQVRVGSAIYPDVYTCDLVAELLKRDINAQVAPLPLQPEQPKEKLEVITFNGFFDLLEDSNWFDETMTVLIDESDSLYVASDMPIPRQSGFISQAAWASIGYATSAAIGVALAEPVRPVVFAGDGGFHTIAQSLATLSMQCPGSIVFIMNNRIYGIEQALIDYPSFEGEGAFMPYNILSGWDYVKLAEAFGATAYRVATIRELRDLLPQLKSNKGVLSVVDVLIPQHDLPVQIKQLAIDINGVKPAPKTGKLADKQN